MLEEVKYSHLLNPLHSEDRVEALLSEYTSASGECPFYDEALYSECTLDRLSPGFPPCRGRCFMNGFCCERLVDSAEESTQE
ncbi:MAG: hypothetical protein WED04_08905 [Promethearchaeati archaeon SRVP18_Atabeyarchaeia-1]